MGQEAKIRPVVYGRQTFLRIFFPYKNSCRKKTEMKNDESPFFGTRKTICTINHFVEKP